MKYFVTVGERTLEVEIDGDVVSVDGARLDVRIERAPGPPEVRAIVDGVARTLVIESSLGTTWRLVDHGAVRDVVVEDERARHIRLLSGSARAVDGHAVLKAPMPGLVLRLLVAPGDQVVAGMPLLALEAMKMENELKASGPGVVTAVLVTPGQAVEKGQKLLEIGPAATP
jgi:biotin carboxyl carrier protein